MNYPSQPAPAGRHGQAVPASSSRHTPLARACERALFEPLETRTLFAAVKIMPLGDSITEGNVNSPTYRYYLWHQLQDAGYDVDFVGQYHGVFNPWEWEHNEPPMLPDFDQDHEGHSGETSMQISHGAFAWASAADPDIVLLHIGTNDVRQDWSTDSSIGWINHAIDELRRANPDVVILLAKIIPNGEVTQQTIDLNNAIPVLAAEKTSAQSPVKVVDMYSGFSLDSDFPTNDKIHPNANGDAKMASRWFNALTPYLSGGDPKPLAPVSVKAEPTKSYVNVKWWDKANNESGFLVQRKTWSFGKWETIAELGANAGKFTDASNLKAGVKYYYRVIAWNDAGSNTSFQTHATPQFSNKYVYASDVIWSKSSNSWGPVERDQSNGGGAAGDGDTMVIKSNAYSKGIGVFGDSTILIKLDGGYNRFITEVGVDKLAGDGGSVQFKLYADGKKIYESGVMTGAMAPKKIDVSVFSVDQLYLIVSSTGDGTTDDYANWGKAVLTA